MTVCITELNIYPIKSCQGITLSRVTAHARGFSLDRQWMVVTEEGQFLTQRQLPKMCQIVPKIISAAPDGSRIEMEVKAPLMPTLTIISNGKGNMRQVVIWRDACQSVDEGNQTAEWFSNYLNTPCRLVRFSEQFVRSVDEKFAVTTSDQVGFADGFPYLLISQASLDKLNSRLSEPLPMNRFRPNIVVKGCQAFAEDQWKRIKIATVPFHVVKPCARCVITCTDQKTAKLGKEPLKTLSTFRNDMNKILFGQNLIPGGFGELTLGDRLEVLS